MASKPYWQQFNPGIDSKHFVTWLEEKASFRPVWKSVSRYARPDSQETFDEGNKKNSSNLESHKNQTRIKQAYKEHLESLQNIESKYYKCRGSNVGRMESRLGNC